MTSDNHTLITYIVLYNIDIHVCNCIYICTFIWGHTGAYVPWHGDPLVCQWIHISHSITSKGLWPLFPKCDIMQSTTMKAAIPTRYQWIDSVMNRVFILPLSYQTSWRQPEPRECWDQLPHNGYHQQLRWYSQGRVKKIWLSYRVVLATVVAYQVPVRVGHCQGTRTGWVVPGCYPGWNWTMVPFYGSYNFRCTLVAIKYLSSARIVTWSIRRFCSLNSSFTSGIQICDATNISWIRVK